MRRNGKKWLAALMLVFLLSGCLPAGASAEKVLTWPSSVKVVGEHMFEGDISIETVVLPEGVERIEPGAFAYCSSLKEIYLPSTLNMTDEELESAFENCNNIRIGHAPWGCDEIRSWLRGKGWLAEYRALVIGEKTFRRIVNGKEITETALRNEGDADHMEAMLNSASGLTGTEDHFTVTKAIDLSSEEIRLAIIDTFSGTQSQDVSLFFIATHGVQYSGNLEMPNGGGVLPIATLADWLNTYVQGKVIVILESCYAGYAIYSPDIQENGRKGNDVLTVNSAKTGALDLTGEDLFAEMAVQVFAEKDPGVLVRKEPEEAGGRFQKNSGEMRVENKFYVLAASRHNEESFGYNNSVEEPMNLFTMWLLEGIGSKKKSPADTSPKDNALTLKELFRYVKKISDYYPIYHKEKDEDGKTITVKSYQHVQCYPKDCNLVCFLLR